MQTLRTGLVSPKVVPANGNTGIVPPWLQVPPPQPTKGYVVNPEPAKITVKNVSIAKGWLRPGVSITKAEAKEIEVEVKRLMMRVAEVTK